MVAHTMVFRKAIFLNLVNGEREGYFVEQLTNLMLVVLNKKKNSFI